MQDGPAYNISHLINFTPNCFAWAAAVINVELGSSIAEKSSKFFHLCAIQSILHKPANSVQNSHVQNYRILASLVVVVREGGEESDTWGTYRLSLSLFQACRQSVCSTYLTFFTWAVVMWPLATNSSATCYRWLCCQGVCDDEMSLKNLGSSATAVTKALDDLMLHIKRGANRGRQVAEAC